MLEHNSSWRFETYKHGTTALMVAVTQGKLEMVKLLLEKDPVSQLEAMNRNAVNALNLALSHKHEDIANYIANKMHETNCMSVVDRGRS
ncbi:MAG: ankyrin repeat domain-containing protein [Pseudomonadota bacterium]|nr:ankyrin repeat domain-containing protein [Pseudomonadota bacterium]